MTLNFQAGDGIPVGLSESAVRPFGRTKDALHFENYASGLQKTAFDFRADTVVAISPAAHRAPHPLL
ncbi:hypothetical protein FHT92_001978 [Rhizobium sp. BK377]|nr:hypothetical protein [Rhizobium sp. BK377]